jgi:hypothetical protein
MISKIHHYLLFFLFIFIIFFYLNKHYNTVYSHIPDDNIAIQEIIDQNDKIKVQFGYDPENISINALTDLKFSVLNSTTNEHIKNLLARVLVTEGAEVFGFTNITVSDGDFSVEHSFTSYGNHQVLLRIDTNSSIIPASFDVMIPYLSSSPSLVDSADNSNLEDDQHIQNFTNYFIIIVGIVVSIVMIIILLSIAKKK